MIGVIAILVVLFLMPVAILMAGGLAAAVVGQIFTTDIERHFEGTDYAKLS